MADKLTNLRELSVAFFLDQPGHKLQSINPQPFTQTCNQKIKSCKINVGDIADNHQSFDKSEMTILQNGYKLAQRLRSKLIITSPNPNIEWVGDNQKKAPVDLIVDGVEFSLKEESNILTNMGLYNLLNIISNSTKYPRGLSVFETFSQNELDKWYEETRDLLISLGPFPFNHNGSSYTSKGTLQKNKLILEVGTSKSVIDNFSRSTYADFKKNTTSKTREKVFSKWIQEKVAENKKYRNSKRQCSLEAGKQIISAHKTFIGKSNKKLLELFRIKDYSYYYCKTTKSSVDIYKVPSMKNALQKIIIKNFSYKVPQDQLNIYTEIENTQNRKLFTFHNQLRYSHGQLNGTPEAKLYRDKGDLSFMYQHVP